MNAWKHGIRSEEVLVQSWVLEESAEELEELHQRFWETLLPEGPVEEMLVDQIVTAHWRLRRALKAEAGEIALSVDGSEVPEMDPAVQMVQWRMFGDPAHAMHQSSLGNSVIQNWLVDLRGTVETGGLLSEGAVQKLAARFGGVENSLVQALEVLRRKLLAEADRTEASGVVRQKAEILAFLDREIGSCQGMQDSCAEMEELKEQAREAAAVLPNAKTLDKIMRYQTALERQMYRAMLQLERVQRMRQGETIPAPLSVEVSGQA